MFATVQVAVALILEKDNKILLGKRAANRDFASNIWEIPAGRLEMGESLDDALRREGNEELGVEITAMSLVDAYQFQRNAQPMLLLTYLCEFVGDISISDEHRELRWVSPEEAIDLFSFEQQKESIRKYLQVR